MKVGDLVRRRHDIDDDILIPPGLVTKVHFWQDPNSDRNVGVDIHVLWSNGETGVHDEMELETIVCQRDGKT